MSKKVHCVIGGAKLQGYGESDSSGKWVKFELPQDPDSPADMLEYFRGYKGQLFDLVIDFTPFDSCGMEEKTKGVFGKYARTLKLSGYFRTPNVWRAIGTDDSSLSCYSTRPSKGNHPP